MSCTSRTILTKKTGREQLSGPPIERTADGTWHVRDFVVARALLRNGNTRQAGFKAELLARMPRLARPPVLYQEGEAHHQQRRQTAHFFAPRMASARYRVWMEELATHLIERLLTRGGYDLSLLGQEMAVTTAARIIGLTHSLWPGMHRRLDAFFRHDVLPSRWSPRAFWHVVARQTRLLAFFLLDVRPALRAHRRAPEDDLISHLLVRGCSELEVLTECLTFAAAGMVTTREFIGAAAWHLLEQPGLRALYLAADEAKRHAILGEILRLEPAVGHLYRRTTADLSVVSQGEPLVIPRGALVDLHIHSANVDRQIVGAHALKICPARSLADARISPEMMSFGDGYHRCPGFFLALQEADILLVRLLALPGLHIQREPSIGWNEITAGYELRDFVVGTD